MPEGVTAWELMNCSARLTEARKFRAVRSAEISLATTVALDGATEEKERWRGSKRRRDSIVSAETILLI
jgi:hypothetical protein